MSEPQDKPKEFTTGFVDALQKGMTAFAERYPLDSIPPEIETRLTPMGSDRGTYYLVQVIVPAPKEEQPFVFFEAHVDKLTGVCSVAVSRAYGDIPPERLVPAPNDPV